MTNRLAAALAARPWPLVMGIVNVTPDSFFDGGAHRDSAAAVDAALAMAQAGAAILDIGAESTRPGSEPVDEAEELARALPVIELLRTRTDAAITIDTRKPSVARAAVAAGADGWNDVSALTWTEDSIKVAAQLGVPVILMHAKGEPRTMQDAPAYHDVTSDVLGFLAARIGAAVRAGVPVEQLLVDPGIGFGKTLEHNLALIAQLRRFSALGRPVLFGASRKSFIGKIDGSPASGRLGGSVAAALLAADAGAAIVRVHDVAETAQALAVWRAVRAAS